jgi:hypothetical protein
VPAPAAPPGRQEYDWFKGNWKKAVTFLKKSNQKTFVILGHGRFHWHGLMDQKFFASFFKKEVLASRWIERDAL